MICAQIVAQSAPQETWGVGIVLPARMVVGERATLAVFGRGREAGSDVNVTFWDWAKRDN